MQKPAKTPKTDGETIKVRLDVTLTTEFEAALRLGPKLATQQPNHPVVCEVKAANQDPQTKAGWIRWLFATEKTGKMVAAIKDLP